LLLAEEGSSAFCLKRKQIKKDFFFIKTEGKSSGKSSKIEMLVP